MCPAGSAFIIDMKAKGPEDFFRDRDTGHYSKAYLWLMKNRKYSIRGIQIGLSTWFLLGFFTILLHVHKRNFQRRDVHKTCTTCLLQYNTIPLKPQASAVKRVSGGPRYTEQPTTKAQYRAADKAFQTNNPNKAPPSC